MIMGSYLADKRNGVLHIPMEKNTYEKEDISFWYMVGI